MAASSASSAASAAAAAPMAPEREPINISRDAHLYLKARNVLLEILEMRGYNVSSLTAESPEEIELMSDDITKYYITVTNDEGHKCRVLFVPKTPKHIFQIIEAYYTNREHTLYLNPETDKILMICFKQISPAMMKSIRDTSRIIGIHTDAVYIEELMVNIFRHELVPSYTPIEIGSEEEEAILKACSIRKKKQLPVILSSDIVSRLLGLRNEQLVLVENKSPHGSYRFVRVCLDG